MISVTDIIARGQNIDAVILQNQPQNQEYILEASINKRLGSRYELKNVECVGGRAKITAIPRYSH